MTERGRSMKGIGITLIVLAVITGLILHFVPAEDVAYFGWWGTPSIAILGAYVFYRGKQYVARGEAQTYSQKDLPHTQVWSDDRPPVVYLRSFSQDEAMASQVLTAPLNVQLLSGFATNEEQLKEAVEPIGPMIAIGRPGERLPKPGARRAYAGDNEWQTVISQWLSVASLVILRAGATEGLWWEIKQVFWTVSPGKILILVPKMKRSTYESFAGRMRDELGIKLPTNAIGGFIEFGNDWTPHFLPLSAPFWRTSTYKPARRPFHYTLRPVYQRLGIGWRPAPISVPKVVSVVILVLMSPLILFGFLAIVASISGI